MKLSVKVKAVKLLITHGTDLIQITLDEKSSFPMMGYETVMKVECQKGFGLEYCKDVLGIEPEILDLT